MDHDGFPPPKQINPDRPDRPISLTGMLMPCHGEQLSLVHMLGVGPMIHYLPLFDDPNQLRSVLERAEVPFDSIKQVDDGPEFLTSVPDDIIVITNLRFTEEGKIRFTQVKR